MKKAKQQSKIVEPTNSELEILQVLWEYGPSTVRFINDMLNEQQRKVQYSSTLKLMQIMADKRILLRDESEMKHVYKPATAEKKLKAHLLRKFVENLYGGSATELMIQLIGNKKPSKKELQAMKDLIIKIDNQNK
jgi:BlaI family penicillinase repressor